MDRNEPLVSVIVPVYNGQEYLENCIRSIQEQTYGNLEILIVNDGLFWEKQKPILRLMKMQIWKKA